MRPPRNPKTAQQGVVLIEAMIAILIFSLGVLALVGLQATMIKATTDSKYRSDASYIAQTRLGQMWADPSNLAGHLEASPGLDISTQLPAGKLTVEQPVPGQIKVTVTWKQPGPNQVTHTFTTTARVTGG